MTLASVQPKACDGLTVKPVGRFAPSPTGSLHLGSLVTAVASYCIAKQQGGDWLVRIENIDSERCQPAHSAQILRDLSRLGLVSDRPVEYQSKHLDEYHHAIEQLGALSYGCDCTRKFIQQYNQQQHLAPQRYPQLCYHRHLAHHHAIRAVMPHQQMVFFDQLQGVIQANPQLAHGDIVLRRRATAPGALGMINYMLAVVIDDARQGVNQIVRGLDILPLTLPQLVLMDYLHLPLPSAYYHLPLLTNSDGQKLSKQTLAEPISAYPAPSLLALALKILGQAKVDKDSPEKMLAQAVAQWDTTQLRGQQHFVCDPLATLLPK